MGKFEVGKRVICIKPNGAFKLGEIKICEGIKKTCCGDLVLLVRSSAFVPGNATVCAHCEKSLGGHWFDAELFAPLEEDAGTTTVEQILQEIEEKELIA